MAVRMREALTKGKYLSDSLLVFALFLHRLYRLHGHRYELLFWSFYLRTL